MIKLLPILQEIRIQTNFPEKGKIYQIKHQYYNSTNNSIAGNGYLTCFCKYIGIKTIEDVKYFIFEYTGFTIYGALVNTCHPNYKVQRRVDFWSKQPNWFKEVENGN